MHRVIRDWIRTLVSLLFLFRIVMTVLDRYVMAFDSYSDSNIRYELIAILEALSYILMNYLGKRVRLITDSMVHRCIVTFSVET